MYINKMLNIKTMFTMYKLQGKVESRTIRKLFSLKNLVCLSLLLVNFNGIVDKMFQINNIRQHGKSDYCSMYIIVMTLWTCL